MPHLVSKQPWGIIDFDTVTGRVLVREDWFYHWRLWPGVFDAWTQRERVSVHTKIDRAIWATWSNKLAFHVRSKSGKQALFGGRASVNFDVRWTTHMGHWSVTVWKMPSNAGPTVHRSFVIPAIRQIELNTADLAPRGAANAAGVTNPNFVTPPHEYAHTMDNDDEYNTDSPFLADSDSLVNIGRQVRGRHLHLIVGALNALVPDMVFSA